jgi:hypothetical protein
VQLHDSVISPFRLQASTNAHPPRLLFFVA